MPLKDPVKRREYAKLLARRIRKEHPERNIAATRKYRATHPERARAATRNWMRRYRAENPDVARARFAQWQKDNKDRVVEYSALRRAKQRQAGGGVTRAQWQAILAAFNHACAYCGASEELQQDHVMPLSRGGAHDPSNVVPACRVCNQSKHDCTPEEWNARKA